MDKETFDQLSDTVLATHNNHPAHVEILHALAKRYSDFGDLDKAIQYIRRAEKIANKLFES